MTHKRAEFSEKTKGMALERSRGFCEGCGQPLVKGAYTYDHIIPDWMGGKNILSNCQVLGHCCDKPKTANDAKVRAKVKRIIKKEAGIIRPKGKIKSRGFQGCRKFNGTVIFK